MNPKISIIVPVYNVEDYIENCLASIKAQTFTDYEVIIINDGSPDKSAEIAKAFCDNSDNWILINKENGGLSSARNEALKSATGDFLCFIDSDDAVSCDYLEKLYNEAVTSAADIVVCGYKKHWHKSGLELRKLFRKKSGMYSSEKLLHSLIMDLTVQNYVWNKLFKRSLFTENGITFPDMRFEDIFTMARLFYYAENILVIPNYLYIYTKRETSIIGEMSARNLNDYFKAVCMLRLFFDEKQCFEKYKKTFKLLGIKVRIIVYVWVLLLHIKKFSFTGLSKNFRKLHERLKNFSKNRVLKEELISDKYLINL